jgi:hypothetical protein
MSDQTGAQYDETERLGVAAAIKKHLHAKGLSRKQLERHDLSLSTINKALAGEFSDATLAKLEAVLGASFTSDQKIRGTAPEALGGYSFDIVEEFVGNYLFVRPLFSNPSTLNAYLIQIGWDEKQACLVFSERTRPDARHTQQGCVYLPFGKPFLNLVTIDAGAIRTILVSQPDEEGLARGIITTLHNRQGPLLIPASAPVVIKRLRENETPALGFIDQHHSSYAEYRALLDTTEEYTIFVTNIPPAERRKGLSIVG